MNAGKNLENAFGALAKELREKYNYTEKDLKNTISGEKETIPASLFRNNLTPLEALSRHLENWDALNRPASAVRKALENSMQKHPQPLSPGESEYLIPLALFGDKSLSPLEHVCTYLKREYNLKNSEIAKEIDKDPRTIWTVLNRAEKKLGGEI